MKKEVFSFRSDIAPGGVVTYKERVKDKGIVEEVRVRFYPGQERALRVRPFVLHKNQQMEDLFTYPEGTEKFLGGDDDSFHFPVSIDVENDDEVCVWVENSSGDWDYTLVCDLVITYLVEDF